MDRRDRLFNKTRARMRALNALTPASVYPLASVLFYRLALAAI